MQSGPSPGFLSYGATFVWSRLGDLNPGPTHYEFLPTVTGWVTVPHDIKGFKNVVIMVTHPVSVHFRVIC
jgi:hypothetical protein